MRPLPASPARLALTALATLLTVAGAAAGAVDPLAPFAVDPGSTTIDLQPAAAVDSQGNLVLAWTRRSSTSADVAVAARLRDDGSFAAGPAAWGNGVVMGAASRGVGFMGLLISPVLGGQAQPLDAGGAPVSFHLPLGSLRFPIVRSDPRGGGLAFGSGPDGAVLVRFGADGQEPDEPHVLQAGVTRYDAAIDGQGNIVLVYTDAKNRLFARRYTGEGKPLGAAASVAAAGAYQQRVAVLPDGRFVVFYLKSIDFRVWARAFRANGKAAGASFVVSRETASVAEGMDVAADADGSILVVWKATLTGNVPLIAGRFVAASGAPVGRQFSIATSLPADPSVDLLSPRAVRLRAGDFRLFWMRVGEAPDDIHLRGRRIAGGPGGDDPCIVSGGALRCDLLHDGGKAEVIYPLALLPGEQPLLGDLDGDGRDEPCVFRGGQFLCDLDRDGSLETAFAYGQAGDVPLLGDLDGDGKDELCVYRAGQFRCAKLPLGSAPETVIPFAEAGARPALGDLNGDGKDDPCTYNDVTLSCDVAHDGSSIAGQTFVLSAGESFFLADVDDDGRADPCGVKAGRFRCFLSSTRREQTLTFGGPQGVPVLGNADGR